MGIFDMLDENTLDDNRELNRKSKDNKQCSSYSNFEDTIRDRKINNLKKLDEAENIVRETQKGIIDNIRPVNQTMLWHARLGHASLKYLKEFQRKFPDVKRLKDIKFDDSVMDCEVCILSKFRKIPFSSTR